MPRQIYLCSSHSATLTSCAASNDILHFYDNARPATKVPEGPSCLDDLSPCSWHARRQICILRSSGRHQLPAAAAAAS